jgi:hypothetical protein
MVSTLRHSPKLDEIVSQRAAQHLPLYTVEAYIGLCQQQVSCGHAILIMQGSTTLTVMKDLLEIDIDGVCNIAPLHKNA